MISLQVRQNASVHNQFVTGRSKYFPGWTTGRKPPKITRFKIHLTMLFCYQVYSIKITRIAVSNRKEMAANSLQQTCSKNSRHTLRLQICLRTGRWQGEVYVEQILWIILQVRVFPLSFQALQISHTIIKQTGNVIVALGTIVAIGTQQRIVLSYMSLSTTKVLTVPKLC